MPCQVGPVIDIDSPEYANLSQGVPVLCSSEAIAPAAFNYAYTLFEAVANRFARTPSWRAVTHSCHRDAPSKRVLFEFGGPSFTRPLRGERAGLP